MKKTSISIALLAGILIYAQKTDTLKSSNIDEVIINSVIKKDSDYSNKMPLKTIEDPQVLSSVSKTVLQNQSIFTVDDAYRNVTGLQKMWTATSRAGDGGSFVVLRGFSSNNSLRNGLVSPVTTTIDAINIEKLEVLKGPSGTLYGSNVASYGGIINRITKKPFQSFAGEASLIGGSYNFYRVQADVNAPITKDKKLLFRVNTAYTNTGTFQKTNSKNTYTAFTPSLTYNASDKLQFNLEYERYDTRAIGEQFFFYLSPTTLNGINNMRDLEKAGLNYKESYTGNNLYTTARVNNIFGQINYKINDHIKSSTNINNSKSYSDGASPYFSVNYNNASHLYRVSRFDQSTRGSKSSYFQVQQNFNFDYNFANGMRNRTVAGFDFLQTQLRQRYVYLNNPFELVSPAVRGDNYSNFNGTTLAAAYNIPGNTGIYNVDADTNTYSGYISNVFTPVAGLNLVLGARYESNDFKGGSVFFQETKPYNQSAFSPKAGIVYEIVKDKFSVFGNYQNSFKSNGYYTTNVAGNIALSDPERANQFEGGFKTNLINGKVNATVSYYDIKVKNSLQGTGQFTSSFQSVQTQAGKIESKGVELEVNAYLVKGFSVIGGIAYNDSKDLSTGLRPVNSGSKWLTNFNASYQFLDGSLKGLGFGVGGNTASENNVTGDFFLPKFVVLNANAFYDSKKFRIGAKVDNFTNEHYWTGFTTANPQQLINVTGTFAYKF
ncbi:TonB-dependent siderophore receptor [Halpernia frigidisoli]|uniref:Iron complex outermembrane recepter protein n=1 Tax=Halpernia frigidisoli TaxID=1125876 RepID=A0A1I3HRF9_9FLAO|nr:TonB-dependent receptor [Halpernia frigidisoli]SFI38356.1 iron complex outermembrane recepter protein [Halpernia frigidisoli]